MWVKGGIDYESKKLDLDHTSHRPAALIGEIFPDANLLGYYVLTF
jgi:hypothetical protein